MRKPTTMAACLLTAFLAAACGSSTSPLQSDGMAGDCTGVFDFNSKAEPLGSSQNLVNTVYNRSASPDVITLQDLTTAAGWADGWDRMIVAGQGISRDVLNTRADLPGYCWENFPSTNPTDHPYDWYIFIEGQTPKQVLKVLRSDGLFQRAKEGALTPETRLSPIPPKVGDRGYFVPAEQ